MYTFGSFVDSDFMAGHRNCARKPTQTPRLVGYHETSRHAYGRVEIFWSTQKDNINTRGSKCRGGGTSTNELPLGKIKAENIMNTTQTRPTSKPEPSGIQQPCVRDGCLKHCIETKQNSRTREGGTRGGVFRPPESVLDPTVFD